jgi:hypothetical protein
VRSPLAAFHVSIEGLATSGSEVDERYFSRMIVAEPASRPAGARCINASSVGRCSGAGLLAVGVSAPAVAEIVLGVADVALVPLPRLGVLCGIDLPDLLAVVANTFVDGPAVAGIVPVHVAVAVALVMLMPPAVVIVVAIMVVIRVIVVAPVVVMVIVVFIRPCGRREGREKTCLHQARRQRSP